MKNLITLIIFILALLHSCSKKKNAIIKPTLKIGLIADPQYAHKSVYKKRHYKESLWKLKECISTFNKENVDFVQNLGDIIDGEWKSYDSILPIYNNLNPNIKNYQLLGNHDFSIDSTNLKGLLKKLSMPNFYYSYTKNNWKFIVLDATDYSFYSNSLHSYESSKINTYYKNTKVKSNRYKWNSAIGKEQQNWLKKELAIADSLKQKVILFSHLPIGPDNNSHNLWNDYEIIEIIENSPNVVAFINGHNHDGGYIMKNGIHYITIFGMVDTKVSSYGILEIHKDSLLLKGYGNQKTLHLDIK